MNSWMNWIGIARRAGVLFPGSNQVEGVMKDGRARIIVIAEDAGEAVIRKYRLWAQDEKVPIVRKGSKKDLGHAAGMGPHAILAISDPKIAERLMQTLGESTGGIIFGGKGQSKSLRTGERTKDRQQEADRSITSSARGRNQKSHEHNRGECGKNR